MEWGATTLCVLRRGDSIGDASVRELVKYWSNTGRITGTCRTAGRKEEWGWVSRIACLDAELHLIFPWVYTWGFSCYFRGRCWMSVRGTIVEWFPGFRVVSEVDQRPDLHMVLVNITNDLHPNSYT